MRIRASATSVFGLTAAAPVAAVLNRFRGLSLSRKFAILLATILLVTLGNALAVRLLLANLSGAAEVVNVSGSLRWRSQSIQAEILHFAGARKPSPEFLNDALADFEQTLAQLDQLERKGHALHIHIRMLARSTDLHPLLASLVSDFERFKRRIRSFLSTPADSPDYASLVDAGIRDAKQIFAQADAVTSAATVLTEQNIDAVIMTVYGLVMVDLVLLLAAFHGVRTNLVTPLRQLARMSRHIAEGDYGTRRMAPRALDEIGLLAAAMNLMADKIEMDLKTISDDVVLLSRQEQSLRRLSWAVEHSPADVMITDRQGQIVYVNPKFSETTGYAAEEIIGRNPRVLQSGRTPIAVYGDLWATILSGSEWRGEFMNRRKGGAFYWASCCVAPVMDDQGEITHFIAVREDVTARKQAEEEILDLNARLEQRVAERTSELTAANRELESFSYSVSHDLRAPLRGINGFCGLMSEACSGCTNIVALDYLRRISRASVRMGELTDGLLHLSHIARMATANEVIDLSRMANTVLDDLRSTSPAREIQINVQEQVLVTGDPVLFRIVLENLLGNAWKFTNRREGASIEFGSREEEGETIVFIRDNGAGFDPAYADKLFNVFQRLHRTDEFEGIGIGLATVKRIIVAHKGRIWAESVPNHGATFYFAIPKAGPDRNPPGVT